MAQLNKIINTNGFVNETNSSLHPGNNYQLLVNQCKFRFPYEVNDWNSDSWNLTAYEKKSLNSRAKQYRLIFALTSSRKGNRTEKKEFSVEFSDLIKSLISVRYIERSVGYGPQQTLLIAFRYLYEVIEKNNLTIENLLNRHFVEAAELLGQRESPSTCYRIGNSLEMLSAMFDRFHLTKIKTNFKSSFKRTEVSNLLSTRTSIRSEKLQISEEALDAILKLDEVVTEEDERLIVETLKLFLFTGLRISELLSLERNCLLFKVENEEKFIGIRYYPLKGGHKEVRIKWFGDLSGKLVEQTIYKIEKITANAREVAKWLSIYPNKSYLRILIKKSEIHIEDLMFVLGTESKSAAYSILNRAGIHPPYIIEKFDNLFRPDSKKMIAFEDSSSGYSLKLQDALFATFQDTFSLYKHKKIYFPELLTEGSFMLVVSGKEDKTNPRKSIFDKYDLKDKDGEKIHITSHMFRRLLNTLYNEGGVPLTILTKVFGRKNSKDTLAYLYTTPKKRTEDARRAFKEGGLIGPKVSLIRQIPIGQRDEAINTTVESVHQLGFGFCLHDWSSLPCEKHIQCLDNCIDFHLDAKDPRTKNYLIEQKESAESALAMAQSEEVKEERKASAQAEHYKRIAKNAKKYLKDLEDYEASSKKSND